MKDIRLKLNKSEIHAVMLILKIIEKDGHFTGLQGKASLALIKKIYISLFNKWDNLKQEKNTFSLSFPEAWALQYQVDRIQAYLGGYELNVWLKIHSEIHRIVIN